MFWFLAVRHVGSQFPALEHEVLTTGPIPYSLTYTPALEHEVLTTGPILYSLTYTPALEHEVLTTGPPGNSLWSF